MDCKEMTGRRVEVVRDRIRVIRRDSEEEREKGTNLDSL